MTALIRVLLFFISLFFGAFSIIMLIFPFQIIELLSIESITLFLENLKGNYLLTIVGLITLLFSIKILLLSFKTNNNTRESISYVVKMNEYGEVKISTDTIVGLVHHVCNRFSGLKNIKVKVDILEGQLYININGEVVPEINIPEIINNLQAKVKEHVENCTGVNVSEIRVFVTNVTMSGRDLK